MTHNQFPAKQHMIDILQGSRDLRGLSIQVLLGPVSKPPDFEYIENIRQPFACEIVEPKEQREAAAQAMKEEFN